MGSLYNKSFYHRDLSWLRFNHRVLQEASDKRNPLYERIKFLAIFSSNLDEFFRVRVSDIRQIKNLEKPFRKRLITKPNKTLKEIKVQVDGLQKEFSFIFNEEIIPTLKKEGIILVDYTQFSVTQKLVAKNYYEEELKQHLSVETQDIRSKQAIFLDNEAIYLCASIELNILEFVKIPETVNRFFVFPSQNGKHYITFVDDILKYNLRQSSKGEIEKNYHSVKISKDAELYIEDEFSGNLKDKIKDALHKRDTGQATRVLVDKYVSEEFEALLHKALDVNTTDIFHGGRYLNYKDFFDFPNPTTKQYLTNEKLEPLAHPMLSRYESVFDAIDDKDQLLHYPYHSFEPIVQLLEEAAIDPLVTKIRVTIYRAAAQSRLNDAIALAAKNGKKVIIFIEVKARFDERNNLKWGAIFEKNGAQVIYSYPDIKVHSKILCITRKVEDNVTYYSYIATGNFNEKTSGLYTDFGLMTSNPTITKEVKKVFQLLNRKIIIPKAKHLLISPFNTRVGFIELINSEIAFAQAGKPAYIILKMNSLEDPEMIKILYRASIAGVKIKLIVRGICCLIPSIKNQSENIEVISIVDRFLEHGRVYIFGNNGEEKVYIGSADWMTRNLNHRIEVVTPILDTDHKKTIRDLIDIQWNDNVKARVIDKEQKNNYVTNGNPMVQSQLATYQYVNDHLSST